jgi:outer membrane autotransporter protein
MAILGRFATAGARSTLLPSTVLIFAALVAGSLAGGISPALAQCVTSGNDITCTNSGSVPSILASTINGNATTTNSGSVGAGGILTSTINGSATTTNSGSVASSILTSTINGNASTTNTGSVASSFTTLTINGNASTTNSGSVASGITTLTINGNATTTNSGSVASGITTVTTIGNATTTNSGSVGANVTNVTTNGNATVVNQGFIGGGITDVTSNGIATLTNFAGSRIVGPITLVGTTQALNFVGGNFLYTLTSLAGVAINTNGAPFAVNGNSVAVLDPTALALEDRSVMNFTGGVSSMLKDRFNGMPVAGGAGGGAMGFAPDAASRMDAAHGAFSGIPSVSMAYSSTEAKKSNANAMYTKAPALAAPVYDTVVWASGFGGERQQWENGPVQRARDVAFGGAIGIDRQFTPDLRLGAFVGGGNSKLGVAYNLQNVDSDYVFGGGYGRWDKRNYYVDFALFGGGLSSSSTRQISNNNVASGLEIATASYHGWFISPDVTYGYRVFMGDYVLTPKARVRYVGGSLDGYTEVGSAQGLTIGKRNLSDIEERLGVEFSSIRPVTFGGTLKSSVEVSGIGLQRLGDNTINAVLLAQNIAFTTPGKSEAFGGVVNVGFEWRPKSNVGVYASVEATAMNDKSFSATGKGGVRVGF